VSIVWTINRILAEEKDASRINELGDYGTENEMGVGE
jgi:hypothetical protein